MTLAIGIERRGRVWIGADSAASGDDITDVSREPKVWRSGGWVLASAGKWREINLARLFAQLPEADGEASVFGVARALARTLEAHGVTYGEGEEPNAWLLGARGLGLWEIVQWSPRRIAEGAIGAGWGYALGWLDATALSDPATRIRECVRAAARRMPGAIRLPVRTLEA